MKKDQPKVDLVLIKRYVKELESSLEETYNVREQATLTQESYADFMIALSKTIGVLSGIATEAGLLIGDLQKVAQYSLPGTMDEEKTNNLIKSVLTASKKRGTN